MIDFTIVSREFRSLVARRRELLMFMGSTFAALAVMLRNVLGGNLPAPLKGLESNAFAAYALALFVPTVILALRIARLHSGMVFNGVLYARLLSGQDFAPRGDPQRAARHNFLSVSFLFFLLADLIAAYAAVIFGLALRMTPRAALALGAGVFLAGLLLYLRFHREAARAALTRAASDSCGTVDRNEWESHVSGTLQDVNHDMIATIAFVGLITFSVFESLSGLGAMRRESEFASLDVQTYGPGVYSSLVFVSSVMGLATYLRLRVALGRFSLQIDPNDRPFRLARLTDSFLGYLLLAFFFVVSVHVLLYPWIEERLVLAADVAALTFAILAEKIVLLLAAVRSRKTRA